MLNRLSLGAGVLCGIKVGVVADKTRVRISSGVAIDYFGREIIVPQTSQPFDPTQPTDDCGRPAGDPVREGTLTLYLCYHECESEPAPALVDECGDSGCENGLIRERYELRVSPGTPEPPGTITDKQCEEMCATPPDGVSRRTVLCGVLGGACRAPDESCVPIATLELKGGTITAVDSCTFRPNVYSNATLLDLILCLAERVDECCGNHPATEEIAIESGDNQVGPAGATLPEPLIARVTLSGAPVANEAVTFSVAAGGGSIGGSVSTLGATFTANTDASGDATLPLWRLGAMAGSLEAVKAGIASGASVTFHANAERPPVQNPPVILAIWPPNGVQLSANANDEQVRSWFKMFREKPGLEITFDRRMRQAQLGKPDAWLRLYALVRKGDSGTNDTVVAQRIPLAYGGTVSSPLLGVGGVTERYDAKVPAALFRMPVRFLVQIDAQGGNIVEAGAPNLLLDAEFAGTRLTQEQLDKLWPLTDSAASDVATFNALASGSATLPQSGDGTPGGRFHSWFEVLP
jgi:hypothetical protein